MNELITIIINVYNGEKFIKKCLDSVINQTYKKIEILIINDGSTDNTLKICKKFKDKRIRIITTKNLGLSMSRNIGIDNANGEYLYNLIKKYNVDIATSNPKVIFDYDFKKDRIKEKISLLDKEDMLKKILLAENMAGTTWNKLIKKNIYKNIRFEDKIINDVRVTYKLVLKTNKIIYSNQEKYYYLKNLNSASVMGYEKTERSIDFYKAINERYETIKKIYPNLIENEISLLRGIIKLYLIKNNDVKSFLEKQGANNLFIMHYSYKMLFSNIKFKEKIKLLLFRINPKFYILLGNIYREKKYKYKYKY